MIEELLNQNTQNKEEQQEERQEEQQKKQIEEILKILTSKKFVRNKEKGELRKSLEHIVRNLVKREETVQIVLGWGYHKNPNLFEFKRLDGFFSLEWLKNMNENNWFLPDEAEIKALKKLQQFKEQIDGIYQPGLEIIIYTTGRKAEEANNIEIRHAKQYHQELSKIAAPLGIKVITLDEIYTTFEQQNGQNTLQEIIPMREKIREEVRNDFSNNPNSEFWTTQIQNAWRNLPPAIRDNEEVIKNSAITFVTTQRLERKLGIIKKAISN